MRLGLMLTALFILFFIIFQLLDGSGRHHLAASAYGTAKAKLCSDRPCVSEEAECWKDPTSACRYNEEIDGWKKFIRDFFGGCKDRDAGCDIDFSIKSLIELTIKIAITATISVAISVFVAVTIVTKIIQTITIEPIKVKNDPIIIKCDRTPAEIIDKPRRPAPDSMPHLIAISIFFVPILIFLMFFLYLAYGN